MRGSYWNFTHVHFGNARIHIAIIYSMRDVMIYTNGFIVKCILPVEEKDCIKQHKNYFGIGSYQSWPLRYLDQYMYLDDQIDEESVCSKNGYFFNLNYKEKGYPRSLRVVSSNEFVMEYVRLCHKEKNGNNHYDGRVGDTYFSYNK